MPETWASNKNKHPGKCLLAAGSDGEDNGKQKRKRRTKEEMLILHAEQVRVAEKKAACEKECQVLLKKIAELEMKQVAADNHKLHHKVDGNWHSIHKIAVLLNIE